MNKEFMCLDGKVVVIGDSEDDRKVIDYYDNLHDVLIHENLIEQMENNLSEMIKETKILEKNIKSKRRNIFIPIIVAAVICLVIPFIVTNNIYNQQPYIINTVFGNMDFSILSTLVISSTIIPIFSVISILQYGDYKSCKRKKDGLDNSIKHLGKALTVEKEKLKELKNIKTSTNKFDEFKTIKVNDKELLEKLRSYINLYYDCGYNFKKYSRYNSRGVLDEKLCNRYSPLGIENIKQNIDENNDVILIKKKKMGRS